MDTYVNQISFPTFPLNLVHLYSAISTTYQAHFHIPLA